MQVVTVGTGPLHRAPLPDGPTAEVVVDDRLGAQQLAAAHVVLPPGGGMPDHSHGDSEALVVLLAGELVMTSGGQAEKVGPGDVVLLARGEQVRLDNRSDQPVRLLAVFAPPTFVRVLAGWPAS